MKPGSGKTLVEKKKNVVWGGESFSAVKGVWKKGVWFKSMEHAAKWDVVLKRVDEDKYIFSRILTLLKKRQDCSPLSRLPTSTVFCL